MSAPQLYTKYATYYDLLYPIEKYHRAARVIETTLALHGISRARILDVACGTGTLLKLLQEGGHDVTGADIHGEMIAAARRKLPNARLHVASMQELPAELNMMNVVICMSAINYNRTPAELIGALREFYRVLRPGGLVVILNALLRDASDKFDRLHMNSYSDANVSIVKIGTWERMRGTNMCAGKFLLLVKERESVDFGVDIHDLYAFSTSEIVTAMRSAGFTAAIHCPGTLEKQETMNSPVIVGVKSIH